MRRWILGLGVGVLFAAVVAPSAMAQTVQEWNTPGSNFINKRDLFPRDLVNGHLTTTVVLPNAYHSRRCWPVMYLLHGSAQGNAATNAPISLQWLTISNGGLLKRNIKAILVLPGSGDTWWINNWWGGLRHPAFESWILQDTIPMVQKRLHVCPSRSQHAIAGLSMGGYGAIYLASQRPDYFGSAGSFSGVLSPESPTFLEIFGDFPTYWGPAGKFYAVGHDPLALGANLRNTRVFVGAGNGSPIAGETTSTVARFEEYEFDQESLAFAAAARHAGVHLSFHQFAGDHDAATWFEGLDAMMAWNPFKSAGGTPRRWTFSTVATTGDAWGYKYAFSRYAPPKQIIQFSYSGGTFHARGRGVVTITPPHGRRFSARIPFNWRHGRLHELRHASTPHLTGGYQLIKKVKVTASQPVPGATQPVTVSFRTAQALPSSRQYLIGVGRYGSGSTCHSTATVRVTQPRTGKLVSVSLRPPATATTPNTWCPGGAYAAVTDVAKNSTGLSFSFGNILGYTQITLP